MTVDLAQLVDSLRRQVAAVGLIPVPEGTDCARERCPRSGSSWVWDAATSAWVAYCGPDDPMLDDDAPSPCAVPCAADCDCDRDLPPRPGFVELARARGMRVFGPDDDHLWTDAELEAGRRG
jgi:hypothetical protein